MTDLFADIRERYLILATAPPDRDPPAWFLEMMGVGFSTNTVEVEE